MKWEELGGDQQLERQAHGPMLARHNKSKSLSASAEWNCLITPHPLFSLLMPVLPSSTISASRLQRPTQAQRSCRVHLVRHHRRVLSLPMAQFTPRFYVIPITVAFLGLRFHVIVAVRRWTQPPRWTTLIKFSRFRSQIHP
ncbi:hypothetical protein BDN72DRAFT_45074 [Pluteus cervinus]|uniref:Uncharacterized protein n=1 Tax=Pluteus cervinus TaxID=181527 RepID=A0ACD3BHS6_9AGAR|nr:hypothetical protein BDN72DRAFT_45074 [Pluteus cervinus]